MKKWYDSYINFPYKHLGTDPESGIDCFNLCRLAFKKELNINIPLSTADFCNIVDEDWYQKTHDQFMEDAARLNREDFSWIKVSEPKAFDVILMSMGSTNVTNHCALFVGDGKILQTMLSRTSGIWPYRGPFKEYTTGIYRWKDLQN
tara:strand:+ start:67 stop:507 length:441 start_codon:yes stop_codon:yes gene_type:complete